MLKHVYAENMYMQRTLNYFVSGSITVRQISCLTSLDSAALRMFNQQQIYLFVQNQTGQRGVRLYTDTVSVPWLR